MTLEHRAADRRRRLRSYVGRRSHCTVGREKRNCKETKIKIKIKKKKTKRKLDKNWRIYMLYVRLRSNVWRGIIQIWVIISKIFSKKNFKKKFSVRHSGTGLVAPRRALWHWARGDFSGKHLAAVGRQSGARGGAVRMIMWRRARWKPVWTVFRSARDHSPRDSSGGDEIDFPATVPRRRRNRRCGARRCHRRQKRRSLTDGDDGVPVPTRSVEKRAE